MELFYLTTIKWERPSISFMIDNPFSIICLGTNMTSKWDRILRDICSPDQ